MTDCGKLPWAVQVLECLTEANSDDLTQDKVDAIAKE